MRRAAFERVDNPHHYIERRRIPDSVPADALKQAPAAIAAEYSISWTNSIDRDVLVGPQRHADEFDD